MTTSISNASTHAPLVSAQASAPTAQTPSPLPLVEPPRTLASRFIILALCLALVLSTLAFGTVHTWSLMFFAAGACVVVALWMLDAWRTGTLRLSRNVLQWPLVGLFIVGLIQMLPLGRTDASGLASTPVHALSLDPYATRFVLIQLAALYVYFVAALVFID